MEWTLELRYRLYDRGIDFGITRNRLVEIFNMMGTFFWPQLILLLFLIGDSLAFKL